MLLVVWSSQTLTVLYDTIGIFFNFNTVSLENSGKVGILGNWGLM